MSDDPPLPRDETPADSSAEASAESPDGVAPAGAPIEPAPPVGPPAAARSTGAPAVAMAVPTSETLAAPAAGGDAPARAPVVVSAVRSTFASRLRQLMFRKAFRIPAPVWPADVLEQIEAARRDRGDRAPRPESRLEPGLTANEDTMVLVAELVTGLWRIRRRLLADGNGEPPEGQRAVFRHVESAWDVLAQKGIEVRDDVGARYVPGMALRVVAFQPTPGIQHEKVIESIRPSIFYRERLLQRGEVIVATPENSTQAAPPPPADD